MIGRICKCFEGENWDSCLEKTEAQLKNMFYEAERQEARQRLHNIQDHLAAQNSDLYKETSDRLHLVANQFDPEVDGDMNTTDIKRLKAFFGDSAKVW